MSQITTELHNKAVESMRPLVEVLAGEGMDKNIIAGHIKTYITAKISQYYDQRETESLKLSNISAGILKKLEGCKDDFKLNKAESIFSDLLGKRNIPFQAQVKIGNYRVDYLIDGWLVFEGDGPHHVEQKEYDQKRDKYIESLGYEIIRLSWQDVALIQEDLLNQIEAMIN